MKEIRRNETRSERDELEHRVRAVIDSIPRGKVATYGQVGEIAGLRRHARFVARVLRELPRSAKLPWHRVISATGRIADHAGGAEQRRRLAREGVAIDGRGRIDLARHRWHSD